MQGNENAPLLEARRAFLGRSALGVGSAALGTLLNGSLAAADASAAAAGTSRGVVRSLHVPPRAKRVIFLTMGGGPSHLETFDPKPALAKLDGQPMPESVTAGQPIAQLQGAALQCLGPMFEFKKWGESGQEITELFPHIGGIADEIAIVRSMHTDQINHDPAYNVLNTGSSLPGRPSMGAWINYGLGSEADDLPGFVVLVSQGGRPPQPLATKFWHNGFLPSRFQGVRFHSTGDAVYYAQNPRGVTDDRQRDVVDAVRSLNQLREAQVDDPEIATRISQYETAFRMQMSVPGLTDFSDEPKHVLDMYGTLGADGSFAGNCLLARRLAERGVRFIQLYHRGWDHHNGLNEYMRISSKLTDRATAALIRDLKRRGLLDDTLIVWGGEFGRTPMGQGNKGTIGRDHHIKGYSMFLCGGGIQGGVTLGATDELGYHAVDERVHTNDLHATMLHLLGIDHKRLTYRFQGRDFRLTDVAGDIVRKILA